MNIRTVICDALNCEVQKLTEIKPGLYSAICKLSGGTVENFRCELINNELLIDTWDEYN